MAHPRRFKTENVMTHAAPIQAVGTSEVPCSVVDSGRSEPRTRLAACWLVKVAMRGEAKPANGRAGAEPIASPSSCGSFGSESTLDFLCLLDGHHDRFAVVVLHDDHGSADPHRQRLAVPWHGAPKDDLSCATLPRQDDGLPDRAHDANRGARHATRREARTFYGAFNLVRS